MSKGLQKDFNKIIRQIRKNGYIVEVAGSSHYVVRSKEGRLLASLPMSASEQRGLKNAMAELRRRGVNYEARKGKTRRTQPKGGE